MVYAKEIKAFHQDKTLDLREKQIVELYSTQDWQKLLTLVSPNKFDTMTKAEEKICEACLNIRATRGLNDEVLKQPLPTVLPIYLAPTIDQLQKIKRVSLRDRLIDLTSDSCVTARKEHAKFRPLYIDTLNSK